MKTLYLNNTMRLLIASTFIIFGTIVGVNPANSAEKGESDSKHYPGSICRDASPEEFLESTTYSDLGYVANKRSNRNLTVVCPLIRDNTSNQQGISAIGVYYTDNHPFENIDCHITSRNGYGYIIANSKQMVSSGISSSTLWLNKPAGRLTSTSYFYLTCSIPHKYKSGELSNIKSIVVTESDS